MQQDEHKPSGHDGSGEGDGHFLMNIGKTVFLAAVLAAAWFFLEWLMGRR